MLHGLLLLAEGVVALGQVELGLRAFGRGRIVFQVFAQRHGSLLVVARQVELLGRVEVHLLAVGVAAALRQGVLLHVLEEFLRLAPGRVDRLDGGHRLFGIFAVGHQGDHLLVALQRRLIVGHIAAHHSQADQRPRHVGVVLRVVAQPGEGADGVVVVLEVHLRPAQLVERLVVERHAGRGILDVQQRGDLAAPVAGQAVRDRLLVVRVDVVGAEELRQHPLVGGDGGLVVPAGEVAVRPADHRILADEAVAGCDIAVEPAGGVGVVPRLEVAVADVVGQQPAFDVAVQRSRVVQVGEGLLRVGIETGAVARLAHPVPRELVEAVGARDVVGRGPEERDRVAEGAAREELLAAQEVGLGVVVEHVGRQLLDVVVGRDGTGVVLVNEGREGHVAVDLVAAGLGGPALDVAGEARRVLVEVEDELGVVERRVFRDLGIEVHRGCVLERLHRGHLVVGAQVGVGEVVVGDLAQRVGAVAHLREVLDGAGVVVHGIEHRAGVEVVLAVHPLVGEVVVVFARLVLVALDQVGLGELPRHALAPPGGQGAVDARAFADDEVVVLLVELAVHDVEIRQRLEARIDRSLPEVGLRLGELLVLIEHHAREVASRGRVVRLRERLQQGQELGRLGVVAQAEGGVAALEDIFGEFFFRQVGGTDEGELRGGLLVFALVEEDPALLEMQHAGHTGRRITEPVG